MHLRSALRQKGLRNIPYLMKIVTVVGARPQFIKCASVSRELRKVAQEILVHTGQHYDDSMSASFFRELEIPEPDYNLGVGSGPHGAQTGEMLRKIEEILDKEKPDTLLIYGDTNSTLAGALAAAKLHVPVAHVEAGLRSFNNAMPEEINRIVADHVSTWLFCPTDTAVNNLKKEGITSGVHQVGDVMLDALTHNIKIAESKSVILEKLGLSPKSYYLATVHRAENTDDRPRLSAILAAFDAISKELPVIWPMHPRTRKKLADAGLKLADKVTAIEPASYLDMLKLESNAQAILTDSGGVQKEAFWLGVPCITLRDETEWVETLKEAGNQLAGSTRDGILKAFRNLPERISGPVISNNGGFYPSSKISDMLAGSATPARE